MIQLGKGRFYGDTHFKRSLPSLTLTDTVYTHDFVDWHYHENPYFTFLLQGGLTEGHKKGRETYGAGNILFHHWDECHYNRKPTGTARGFHLEIESDFLKDFDLSLSGVQGNRTVGEPQLKILFCRLLAESKSGNPDSGMVIESLVLEILSLLSKTPLNIEKGSPRWVGRLREILADHDPGTASLSLSEISGMLDIHPVHLSRSFTKYFPCTLGDYVRMIKIEKAAVLLLEDSRPLTSIAYDCGFADQSHLIRVFKTYMGINPSFFRNLQKKKMLI